MTAPFTYYYPYEFCVLGPFTHLLHVFSKGYTAGKRSINHFNFLSKHISKGSIYMIFSPDVGNKQSNPYMDYIYH